MRKKKSIEQGKQTRKNKLKNQKEKKKNNNNGKKTEKNNAKYRNK